MEDRKRIIMETIKNEKALDVVRQMVVDGQVSQSVAEKYFPELAESENERIKKWVINEIKIKHHCLDEENAEFVDKAIAWLEKQGEC